MSRENAEQSNSYTPPTDQQLERFVAVILRAEARRRGIGPINEDWGARMVMRNSVLKDEWLRRHRAMRERYPS